MNTTNPFQLPVWARLNREQRRQARFKKMVITTVAVAVFLLTGLLILGCKTAYEAMTPSVAQVSQAPATVADPKPAATRSFYPAAMSRATLPMVKENSKKAESRSETVYVVKAGDTLTGIAKAHGTTVKAIETANSLANDRILIGEKLKIPQA